MRKSARYAKDLSVGAERPKFGIELNFLFPGDTCVCGGGTELFIWARGYGKISRVLNLLDAKPADVCERTRAETPANIRILFPSRGPSVKIEFIPPH